MSKAAETIVIWVRHATLGWQKHTVIVYDDRYQDVKTKEQFPFGRGNETATKNPIEVPGVYRDGTHTAIAVGRSATHTEFISMERMEVEKAPNGQFDAVWSAFESYPVRRAAEKYLGYAEYKQISSKTRGHLERIVANPATIYSAPTNQPEEEPEMATKPAAKTADKQTVKPTAKAPAKAEKPAAKKPAAKAEKPTKAEKPAKTAPWNVPTAKTAAPAKAPAKQVAEPKATAKAAAPKAAAKKPAGDVDHVVKDDSKVKRGFLRDYVDEAKKLGTFTRDKLVKKFVAKEEEERLVRYFAYCVGNGIFFPAK